ncbi:hypothetical protein GYMLUDRAFT_90284 [Collybiopsis luxurians FD-317 M1]|nr:hypothetical protein GYMLUDRAFT_90284 [Collybiopsis luxurians FD-317 M1]
MGSIEKGSISLIENPAKNWNDRKAVFTFCSRSDIMEECDRAISARRISLEHHLTESNEDIVQSVQSMFLQREIIEDYRRFVVLKGENEEISGPGIEFWTLGKFEVAKM